MRSSTVAVIAVLATVAYACEGPFCDRVDYGTCGNACCKMSFDVNMAAADLMTALSNNLMKGGPDGRYTPQQTAEGTLLFADLRPFKIPGGVDFLGQVHHSTKVHHYNDTINILISDSTSADQSTLVMFSTSQIAGAYGDASQNYANIMNVVANITGLKYTATTVFGCPAPSTPALRTQPSAVESLHASCRANFTFSSTACGDVSNSLVAAAASMSGFANCGSSEKCGYTITSHSPVEVKGIHETPKAHYKDDLSFALTPIGSTGCEVGAYSTSEIWYAVLDKGTNYCNLHNLVSATKLAFQENVDTSDCTQYSSADCSKY